MDFSEYNLLQLKASLNGIDKKQHPERVVELQERISHKEAEYVRALNEMESISGLKMNEVIKDHYRSLDLKAISLSVFYTVGLFFIILSIFALLGADTVSWNEEQQHGIMGLLYGLLMGVLFSTLTIAVIYAGTIAQRYASKGYNFYLNKIAN